MKKHILLFIPILFFLANSAFCQPQILINEFLAMNQTVISDPQGDYDDWIELYNAGDSTVNIGNMYLSDDPGEPQKWQIPFDESLTNIPAKGFLLLWADSDPDDGTLHLGFKLSGGGESVTLTAADGQTLLDRIDFGQQTVDISFGRQPDGSLSWMFFEEPTPAATNGSGGTPGKAPDVCFSRKGGFYSGSVMVSISSEASASKIHYTTDATDPDENSPVYQQPFLFDSTTTLRACAIVDSLLPGNIASATYLIDEDSNLPAVLLISDPKNLWGSSGILDHRTAGWERPVHIEYLDEHLNPGFQLNGGIKIHAPDGYPQQSFRLYARNRYGTDEINYKIFKEKNVQTFKVLVLRNGSNDGMQLTNGTHLRDPMMHMLYLRQNPHNGVSAYQAVNVFLNGDYYGIYNLRERQDKYFLKYNYGADEEQIDFLERSYGYDANRHAIEGDWENYDAMRVYLDDNDMSLEENYVQAQSLLDIRDFSGYWITEIFGGNFDWLSNNQKFWRGRKEGSLWKWVMWDVDHALGLPHLYNGYDYGNVEWNTLDWATGTEGPRVWGGSNTLIVRNLLENEDYKNYFINFFADLLNTTFKPENSLFLFDSLKSLIEPDAPRQLAKWGNRSLQDWNAACEVARDYLSKRPDIVRDHLKSKFALDTLYTIDLNVEHGGDIQLNSITIKTFSWQGQYFRNIPVTLTALPHPGYVFSGWQSDSGDYAERRITLNLKNDFFIQAYFSPDSLIAPVINEINYKSGTNFDAEDWVEIYNPSLVNKDISGWVFKDEKDSHHFTFPPNTFLKSHDYVVICVNKEKFQQHFPQVQNVFGDMDFGLSSSGENIRLFNDKAEIIDELTYGSSTPWPEEANGQGNTLELTNPMSDNSFAKNWAASQTIGGTPGSVNSTLTAIKKHNEAGLPFSNELFQNYPNPFNPETKISWRLAVGGYVKLDVYNILGQKVKTLQDGRQKPGIHKVRFNGSGLPSGTYFYILQYGQKRIVKKMLLLR